jgi:cell division septal protein FtsQ
MRVIRTRRKGSRAKRKHVAARRRQRTYGNAVNGAAAALRFGAHGISWADVPALLVLLASAVALLWFFLDTQFYVYEVDVRGTEWVSADEVYRASGLNSLSVFYVDRADIAKCICEQVPGVVQAYVECRWPNSVHIHIREGEARFVWYAGSTPLIVDRAGRILGAAGDSEGLLVIRDLDEQLLEPGGQIDRQALDTVDRLHSLLPEADVFEYSSATGVSLLDAHG